MKQLRFVVAPKVATIVLAALLFPILHVAAQDKLFAYHHAAVRTEKVSDDAAKEVFNVKIMQVQKDQLLFTLSVENPANEKLTLYIKDNNNNTLHREALPVTARFEGRYNLQSLEDGDYIFEIRSGKTKIAEKAIGIKTQTQVNRNVSVE
ncbi:hypothetical protein [Chitinophaga nivalis]|uniref:Uncharacterized protein n=1 Tax=Chitinophaga nivalis TaxID=2991709 RepID=A0ABT3IVF4_9BACT|nr:hypothetical protein [Chitinophaga nivalis]MCW3462328.1 hypothetical protein [Chitinophaga nivalis]MCW3487981.1 hypothetical protein [Chitinophaga nivalis]